MDGCTEAVGQSEQRVGVVRQADRQADKLGRYGGARGRLIGHGEVSRNGQVNGNGRMGGSSWVIGVMSGSDRTSKQTIGCREMQGGVDRLLFYSPLYCAEIMGD